MKSAKWIENQLFGLVRDYNTIWLKQKYDPVSAVHSVHVIPVGVLDDNKRLRCDINRIIGEFVELFDDSDLWFGDDAEWENEGSPDFETKGIFFGCSIAAAAINNGLEQLPSTVLLELPASIYGAEYGPVAIGDILINYVYSTGVPFSFDRAQVQNDMPEPEKVDLGGEFAFAA